MTNKFITESDLKADYAIDLDTLTPQELTDAIETSPLNLFAAWEVVDGGVMFFETMDDHDTWIMQA